MHMFFCQGTSLPLMISVWSASWKDCVSSTWAIKKKLSTTSPWSSASEFVNVPLICRRRTHWSSKRTLVHTVTAASILVKRRLNTTTIWFPMRCWSMACCAWSKAGERKRSNTWKQQSEWFCVASLFLYLLPVNLPLLYHLAPVNSVNPETLSSKSLNCQLCF